MQFLSRAFARSLKSTRCLQSGIEFHTRTTNNFYNFSTLGALRAEPADMGKDKVQFQLKTPKGTKDCTHVDSLMRHDRILILASYDQQGMDQPW